MANAPGSDSLLRRFFRALGPAIIVASVVLGPGSILTASKVGTEHGYDLLWVLVASTLMMIGMVGLSAHLGVTMRTTLCGALAARVGRWAAVVVGLTAFLIVACFQTSNNVAVNMLLFTLFSG